MSSARPEPKTVALKTQDKLLQSAFLPNGNLLCLHKRDNDNYGFSVINPDTGETVADSKFVENGIPYLAERFPYIDFDFEERYGIPRLYLVSDQDFLLLHNINSPVRHFRITDYSIAHVKDSNESYQKVFVNSDQTLVGLRVQTIEGDDTAITDYDISIDIIDPMTFKILQTGPIAELRLSDQRWTVMPSGRAVKYCPNYDHISRGFHGIISVYNQPHDEKPAKQLKIREFVGSFFGDNSHALAENIVIYTARYGTYFIHQLETNKIVELNVPEKCRYIFAPVSDNKTLIAVHDNFYLLDNETMTLEQMTLNQNVGKRCTSIATCITRGAIAHTSAAGTSFVSDGRLAEKKGHESIALTFSDDDTIYFSNAPINKEKSLEAIMAGIPKFSRSLSGVVLSYFGLGLFSGSLECPRKIEDPENAAESSSTRRPNDA